MSTATSMKKGRRRSRYRPDEELPPRRRRRWLFTATVLLGVPALLWFAPAFIASRPIINRLIAMGTRDFHGSITVEGASLAWLSPVVIREVEICDAEGHEMVKVPQVSSGTSLLGLISNSRDLGTFHIEKPHLHVRCDETRTNLEEAISAWTAPSDQPANPRGIALVINEATLEIDDLTTGRKWQVDDLDCEVSTSPDPAQPLSLAASGHVSPGNLGGEFSVRLKMTPAGKSASAGESAANPLGASTGEIAITSHALPIELFDPFLRRVANRGESSGVLDIDINGDWDTTAAVPRAALKGQLAATHLLLVGPFVGEDRLALERVQIPCSLTLSGSRLEIHQCELQTDVGQLTCEGVIDQLDPAMLGNAWGMLPHTSGELKGSLDLAHLSRLLPATLRVRDGLTIEQGQINLDVTSGPTNGQWNCSGRVETTRLVAVEEGRELSWDQPLLITLTAHDTPQGPVVEKLTGQSDFLKLEGNGTPEFFSVTANFELARLGEQLKQFLELGDLRLAGEGWGRVNCKRTADGAFAADAELQATNLVIARPGKPEWNDPKLQVTAGIKGAFAGGSMQRVEAAEIEVASATDEFAVSLLAPVEDLRSASTAWPFESRLRGDLKRWVARAEPWFGLPPGWDISGEIDAVSTIRYAADTIAVEKCQADFTQLHAWGPTVFIDEPRMRATATAKLDVASQKLQIDEVSLTTADVAGSIKEATLDLANPTGKQRIEQAELQGNVATLARWFNDPRFAAAWILTGQVDCKLHADLSAQAPALDLNLTLDDLTATPRGGKTWRERQVRLVSNVAYDQPSDVLQLAHLELDSQAVRVNAQGKIDRWSKDRLMSISGQTEYDLDKLSLILQPYLNGEVQASGHESRSFSLTGPLTNLSAPPSPTDPRGWIAPFEGKAAFAWQSATLYGFNAAPGELQAKLGTGTLQVLPAKLSVGGGMLNLAPSIRFTPAPAALFMPPGPLAEHVQATPAMCEHWLKYALPPLFRAPKVEGSFSVQLAGCTVPLDAPKEADVAGQLTIHNLDLDPGPLMQEFAVILGKPAAARLAQNSKVDFKVEKGRVYHRGLQLQFPELTVQTYGSVGFDHTLAIMAEMSMPPLWIKEGALADALKGKPLQIPIGGTLEKPKLDQDMLAKLRAQFVRDAAQNLLNNELQRGLDRLLSPLQPKQ